MSKKKQREDKARKAWAAKSPAFKRGEAVRCRAGITGSIVCPTAGRPGFWQVMLDRGGGELVTVAWSHIVREPV